MKQAFLLAMMVVILLPIDSNAQNWSWTWVRKVGFAGLNDPFCVNPLNPNTIYSSAGNNVIVVSRDRGKTWSNAFFIAGGNQIKSIEVSIRDTSVIIVAQEGDAGDRIMKSTNNGATWTQTLAGNFYYFGHPLAYESLLDDERVYTMASNVIYRSNDFGTTWDSIGSSASFGSSNSGWEDAFIRPDSSNILFVADNGTGIWKSTTSGTTWRRVHSTSGEVPGLALNRQNPSIAYATRWGGGGGFLKSTNFGETWQQIAQFAGLQTWGVAVSRTHPDYVAFGTWGPAFGTTGGVYVSRDAGTTWERTFQGFSQLNNHSVFIVDTSTVLSLWGDGIWKLRFPGSISGIVYNDQNANGVRDSGEAVLPGWKVRISGARTDSVVTGISGSYSFSLLAPGAHTVTTDLKTGWGYTAPSSSGYSLSVSDGEMYDQRTFGVAAPASVTSSITDGWNMVSLPLLVADARRAQLFPTSNSNAFTYSPSGYSARDTIENGRGYWLKFSASQTVVLGGDALESDTIDVVQGWNMIGSITSPVQVDSIQQVPPGIVTSSYFRFVNGTYGVASTIEPMSSYWVKVNQHGVLVLQTPKFR